jgi:Carboxypeptidase regulatory-like domain
VSVIEGEVHVQRGDISQTLLAGQQASTSPTLGPLPADAGNGWVNPQRLALLQAPPPPPQTPAVDSGVTLRGVVRQTSTGMGIPDVMVTLCPASAGTRVRFGSPVVRESQGNVDTPGQLPFSAPVVKNKTFFLALWDGTVCQATPGVTTDSSGRFQFSNVVPGEYVVTAEREGYVGASTNGPIGTSTTNKGIFRYFGAFDAQPVAVRKLLGAESQNVTVEPQKTPQEVSLPMIRAGVISGHVRDADGKLLVNAQVRIVALPVQGAPGDEITVAGWTTNDLGEYRAYWLLPGDYHVVATGPAGRLSAETWFPRGAAAAEANSVPIREGEEVSSIDIILRPALPSDTPVVPGTPGLRFQFR